MPACRSEAEGLEFCRLPVVGSGNEVKARRSYLTAFHKMEKDLTFFKLLVRIIMLCID